METYNGKGKLTGKIHQKVIDFSKTSSGFKSKVKSTTLNEKGKELTSADIEFTCDNGIVLMDMKNFIQEDQMKAYEGYEVKVEAEALEFPSELNIGQILTDGFITITATNSPLPMKTKFTISDRKVEAKETVTTPAGTFECFKITSKLNIESHVGITMNFNFISVDWIALKVGTVKNESYSKNGKLNGSSLLTMRK
jgi:hypothetical protein